MERTAAAVNWARGHYLFLIVNPIVEIEHGITLIFPFCGRTLT